MQTTLPHVEQERRPDMRASSVYIEYMDAKGIVHSIEVMLSDHGEVNFRHLRQAQPEHKEQTDVYLYGARMTH